jgi:hypothetical protein
VSRHLLLLVLVLSFNVKSFTQRTYIDRLPVEGGSIVMVIDWKTSLDSLILRLSGDWKFIETGKMYWFGYTNDMFSIAARGDSAIGPLVKVVETSTDQKARLGAICTLHLIGIDRKIRGRFVEAFVDAKARNALLSDRNNEIVRVRLLGGGRRIESI